VRRRIVECVPNFSEGRNPATVDAIADAIARGPGVAILGKTMDADHNRSVITFVGSPAAVGEAAVRAVAKAAEKIDLREHAGVHPRIGATDVLPFVPVEGVTMEECIHLAHTIGEEIWRRLGVPVYFYEQAALRPERRLLEYIRRGEFETARALAATDPDRRPDVGGPELHASAGATVVGARTFLIAYNINLATEDVSVARRIAKRIRASSGGFPHVKALGLHLLSRKQSQVSMNLTDFRITPVHVVFDAVREHAEAEGVRVAGSEIIGLIPKAALEMAADHYLRCENFSPDAVLENRLAEALPYSMDDLLDQLSDPKRAAGGGSAAALSGAMAAALGVLTARLMKIDPQQFIDHREFFRMAADRDAQAFAGLMHSADPPHDALMEATEAPLRIAERAHNLHGDLQRVAADCPQQFVSDVTTAMGLALSAKSGAITTVELNLSRLDGAKDKSVFEARLGKLK
jgi:glutamate formiminotransferase/formiminotetrahydrofolate cyclodeaminase